MSRTSQRFLAGALAALSLCCAGASVAIAEPTPITKAQAQAFAQAVNLQASDLPGATALPEGVERSPEEPAKRELQCGQRGKELRRPLFDEASGLFDPAGLLASAVIVMATEPLAEALSARLASQRSRSCLVRALGEAERVEGEKTVTSFAVKVKWVSLAKTLGPDAVGVHILAKLPPVELPPAVRHKLKRRLPKPKASFTHVDAVFFRVGPAEIMLLRLGVKPFPPATESQALSALYGHAEEHKL
ncbi:MAG: hypothetical protein WBV85_01450 [Solirubrobacteraceae bacterium]